MGAGRLAIVGQLVVEACCSLWGRRPSIALARWSLDALLAVAPAGPDDRHRSTFFVEHQNV
jgi:hypothetical protein